jgi:hypothetical protein
MRRREFIIFLGIATATWPFTGRAQQPAKVARIGFLGLAPARGFREPGGGIARRFAPSRLGRGQEHPHRIPLGGNGWTSYLTWLPSSSE